MRGAVSFLLVLSTHTRGRRGVPRSLRHMHAPRRICWMSCNDHPREHLRSASMLCLRPDPAAACLHPRMMAAQLVQHPVSRSLSLSLTQEEEAIEQPVRRSLSARAHRNVGAEVCLTDGGGPAGRSGRPYCRQATNKASKLCGCSAVGIIRLKCRGVRHRLCKPHHSVQLIDIFMLCFTLPILTTEGASSTFSIKQ